MALITTAEAAERLGVHQTRVQVLIRAGRFPAQMMAGTYLINEENLDLVANRKPGRPKKPSAGETVTQVPNVRARATATKPKTKSAKQCVKKAKGGK